MHKILNPTIEEILNAMLEAENKYTRFAVAFEKCEAVVEHLSKGKTGRLVKNILFFLHASNRKWFQIKVTGKRINLGNWGRITDSLHTSF